MNNIWLKFRNWFLLLGDIIILYASLGLTLLIRYQEKFQEQTVIHLKPFSFIFIIWVVIFYIANLYDLRRASNKAKFFLNLLAILIICAFIGMGFFYLLPGVGISPKTNMFLDVLITTVLMFGWRLFFNSLVSSPSRKIIFIGDNKEALSLATAINHHPQWGYEVGVIIPPEKFFSYKNKLRDNHVQTIVLSNELYQTQELTDALYESLSEKIEISSLTRFYEQLVKKIPLSIISKAWFLNNLTESNKITFDHLKRLLDIIVSTLGLIITLPLYPLFYLIVKTDSAGPLFYTQTRLGLLGKKYVIIKFRTMVQGAEKNGAEWALPNDPRVTRVGKFLRKTRLDELPQLFNVLWGEMSFVGPRPERPEFIKQLEKEIPYYRQRLLVKPGVTGWAQVNYKYSSDIAGALEKLQFDLYYIKNRSPWLDLTILLKTINIVLKGGGH